MMDSSPQPSSWKTPSSKTSSGPTNQEIRAIIGNAHQHLIDAIRQSGACYQEIAEACTWLDESDYMSVELEGLLQPRVRRVYDLLDRHSA